MSQLLTISVSSTIKSPLILQKAATLANNLGLELIEDISKCDNGYILCYTDDGLKLLSFDGSPLSKLHPLIFIDFIHGTTGYRIKKDRTIRQPLAKAVGLKQGYRPTILDGTAGLGIDGYILASLGCKVTLCERSKVLGSLLRDALHRAEADQTFGHKIKDNITLILSDTKEYLLQSPDDFDTIYLDPMYPHRTKSALTSQEMRTIRRLVGDDTDFPSLFAVCLKRAKKRIVVKRPKSAPYISEVQPSHTITMKNNRFDVYMVFQ